jgi:tRNA (guanine37-N1)-methyltransferase
MKRGQEAGLLEFHVHNIRDYSTDKHNKVDDTPYGGGAGMLMTCQPLFDAIRAIKKENDGPVIFMTPQGKRFTQEKAVQLANLHKSENSDKTSGLILLCGRYEGIDQRVRDKLIDEEISIGDFVLTGGELPALTIIDAIARLIPGVLGDEDSFHEDSFSKGMDGMLEHPHYTKPAEFEGLKVPDILLSGNHAEIEKWRRENRRHAA